MKSLDAIERYEAEKSYVENFKEGIRIAEVKKMMVEDEKAAERLMKKRKEYMEKMPISELCENGLLKELSFNYRSDGHSGFFEDTVFIKMDMKSGEVERIYKHWENGFYYDNGYGQKEWQRYLVTLGVDPDKCEWRLVDSLQWLGTWRSIYVSRGNNRIYGFDIQAGNYELYTTEDLKTAYFYYLNFSEGNMQGTKKIENVKKVYDEEAIRTLDLDYKIED